MGLKLKESEYELHPAGLRIMKFCLKRGGEYLLYYREKQC